jgi:hypothetical protein
VIPSILLTDSCDPGLITVAARTPGGRVEVRPSEELAASIGEFSGLMAVVVYSSDAEVLRSVVE